MLNENIRALRQSFGWSQVELAKRLSITKQTVSNWENDNIQPSIDMLVRLAGVFNVTTDYLLGLDNIPRLDIGGVPPQAVAHIAMLVDDLRGNCDAAPETES